MKKHPIFTTLLLGAVILSAGICTAYYNTKSLTVDGNTVLFAKDGEGISVLDFKIYYNDVKEFYNETKPYLPQKAYSTAPYMVVGYNEISYIINYNI